MKYTLNIEINLPRDKVIELFDNPDNLKHWQPGFISYEHLSGDVGIPGSKTKLVYKMNRRDIEMIETLTVHNLPDEISGTYKAKGVWNYMKNTFAETEKGTTIYTAETEFKAIGFMKLMLALMPGAFKKQTYKYMKLFKEFAEGS